MSQRSGQNWRGGNRRGPNRPTHNPGSVHSRLGVPRAGNRSNPGARRNGPNAGGRRWQNVADRGNEREEGFLQDARERLEEARRRGLEYEQPGFQEAMIQDRIFVVENQVYGQDDGMPSLQVETAAPGDVDYRRDNGSLQVTVEPGHHDVDYRRVQVKTSDSERGSYGMEPSPPHHDRSHDNPRHEPYRMYPSDYPEMAIATHERSAERDFRDPYDRRDVRHETPERADLEPFDIGAGRAGDFRDRSPSRTRDDRRQFPQDRDRRSNEFKDDRGRDRNRRSREDDQNRNRLSRENDQVRDRNRLSREDDRERERSRLSREDDREQDRNRHSRNVDGGSDTNRRSGDVEPVSDWEAQLRERAREFGRQQKEESRQRGSRERTDPWLDSHEEHDSRRASWERQERSRSYDRLQEDVYDREQGDVYDHGQRYRREELVGQSGAAYRQEESYRDDRAYSAPRSPAYDNAAFPGELPPDGRDARDQYLGSGRREDQSALQQTGYDDDVYRNFPGDQSPRYALDEFGRPVAPLHQEEYLPAGSGIHGDRIHGDRHAHSSSRTPSPVVLHGHEEEMYDWDRGKGHSSDSLYSAVSSKPIPDVDNRGEYRPTDRGPHVGDPYGADYGRVDAREREYQYGMQEDMQGGSLEYQPSGDPGRGEQPSWNSRQEERGEQRSWNSRQEKREGRDGRASRDAGRRERYAEGKQEVMDRDRDLRNQSEREGERSRSRDQGRRDSQGKREQHTSSRPRDRDYEQQRDLQRSLADEINKIRQDPDQADKQRKTEHQRTSRSSRGNSRDQQSYRKRSEKSGTTRTSEQRLSPKPAGKDSRSVKRKRSQSPRHKSRGRQEDGRGSRSSRDKEGDGRRRRSPRDSRREGSRRGQSPRDESHGRKEDTREKRTRGPSPSDQTNPRQQQFAEEESGQLWPLQPPSTMAPQGQEATNWALETPQVHDQHVGLPPWQPVSTQGSYQDFDRDGSSLYHSSAQESTAGMGPQSGDGSDMPPGERGRTIVEIQPAVETGHAHTSELWELQNAGSKTSESLPSHSQPITASQKGATQANLVEIPSFQQAQEMKKQKSKSSLELPSAPQRFPPSMSFPEKLLILAESYGVRTRQEVEVRIHKYEKEVKDGYLNSRTEDNMDDKAVEHLAEHLPRGGLWKLKLLRRIIVECLPKKTAEMKNKILWLCKQLLPPEGIEVTEAVFTALLAKRVTKYGLKKSSTAIPTPANLQQLEPKQVKNEEKRDMVVEYLQRLGVPATREAINGMLQNNQMLENIEKTFWVPHQDRRLVERYLQQIQVPVTPEAVNKIMGNPDILADIKKTLGVQGSKEGNDDPQSSAMATSSMATASHKPPASLSMTQKGAAISTKSDAADAGPYQHLLSTAPRHQNQPTAPLAMAGSTAASMMYKQPSPHVSQASSRGLAGTDTRQQRVQNSPYGGPAQMHGQQPRQPDSLHGGYSEGGQQPRQLDSSHAGYSKVGQQPRQLMHGEGGQQPRQLDSSRVGYSEGGQQPRQLMHGEGGQQQRQLDSSRAGYSKGGQQQRQLDSSSGGYSVGGQQPRQLDSSHGGYSEGGQQQRQLDSLRGGYSEQPHRAEAQPSGMYGGYDSATQRAATEYRGRVDPAQQQMYAPTASPLQPGISERLQHFTTQAAGPAAMAGESLESTRVFIMDLFRQVNLAWVPESTVQEILRNQELVEQIQRFRAVGMPLELLVNYLKQCLQLVSRP